MTKGPDDATRHLVDERDEWRCVRCGYRIRGGSRHHRQLRRHGLHDPANLVLLCGSGTTGCHGWVHSHPREAYEVGLLVHSWDDPTLTAVLTWRGWLMLATSGEVRSVDRA